MFLLCFARLSLHGDYNVISVQYDVGFLPYIILFTIEEPIYRP